MGEPAVQYLERDPVVTIGVCSGKGGVGKTNAAINLAAALGNADQRVLLMDADLGLANIDVLLGCRAKATLEQVVCGSRTIDDVVLPGPRGVKIIPAASGVAHMADLTPPEQISLVRSFSSIDLEPQYLIVDIGAGIGSTVLNFCSAVQHLVVVVCDEPASLTDAYGLIKVLSQRGVKRFSILANMVRNDKQGYQLYHKLLAATDKFLDVAVTYLGTIPTDDNLKKAIQNQVPVFTAYPASRSAKAYQEVSERLQNVAIPLLSGGRIEFFIERLFHGKSLVGAA